MEKCFLTSSADHGAELGLLPDAQDLDVFLAAAHEAVDGAGVEALGAPLAHHVARPQVPVVAQGNSCEQTTSEN